MGEGVVVVVIGAVPAYGVMDGRQPVENKTSGQGEEHQADQRMTGKNAVDEGLDYFLQKVRPRER